MRDLKLHNLVLLRRRKLSLSNSVQNGELTGPVAKLWIK